MGVLEEVKFSAFAWDYFQQRNNTRAEAFSVYSGRMWDCPKTNFSAHVHYNAKTSAKCG